MRAPTLERAQPLMLERRQPLMLEQRQPLMLEQRQPLMLERRQELTPGLMLEQTLALMLGQMELLTQMEDAPMGWMPTETLVVQPPITVSPKNNKYRPIFKP
jgi:hypothetical protein